MNAQSVAPTIFMMVLMFAAVLFLVLLVSGFVLLVKKSNSGPLLSMLGVFAVMAIFAGVMMFVLLFSWRTVGSDRVLKQSSVSGGNFYVRRSQSLHSPAVHVELESHPQSAAAPQPPAPASPPAAPAQLRNTEIPSQDNVIPALWHDSDSDLFTARIYPSMQATAKPLARKLSDKLRTLRPGGGPDGAEMPTRFRVTSNQLPETYPSELLDEFTGQLRKEFADAEVTVEQVSRGASAAGPRKETANTELEVGEMWIQLQIKNVLNEGAPWDSRDGQEKGVHTCRAETSDSGILLECDYIEKPWLEDFDVFVSLHPSRRFVVGYSTEPASSEDEARRLAMEDAIAKSPPQVGPAGFVAVGEQFVVDRFAQKLSRHYGDVWREAVLLDVSPETIAPAVSAAQARIAVTQAREQSALVGVFVLLGFTALLCAVLNAITQGYYRKHLIVGVMVLIVLAGAPWVVRLWK